MNEEALYIDYGMIKPTYYVLFLAVGRSYSSMSAIVAPPAVILVNTHTGFRPSRRIVPQV